jgi:hypothetical protein
MAAWGIVPCHHGRTLVRPYPCLPRLQVVLRGRRGFRTTPNATCRGGRPRPPSLVAIFTPGGISSRTHASRSSPLKPAVNSFLSKRAGRRRGLGSPPVCELRRHHRQPARDVKSSPIFLCNKRRCGPTYARARTRTPTNPGERFLYGLRTRAPILCLHDARRRLTRRPSQAGAGLVNYQG